MSKILRCPYTNNPVELPPSRGEFQDIIDHYSYSAPEQILESSSQNVQKPTSEFVPLQLHGQHVSNNLGRSLSIEFNGLMDMVGMEIDRSFQSNDESVSCRSVIRFLFVLTFFILLLFQVFLGLDWPSTLILLIIVGLGVVWLLYDIVAAFSEKYLNKSINDNSETGSLPTYDQIYQRNENTRPPPYKEYDSPPSSDNGPPTYDEV